MSNEERIANMERAILQLQQQVMMLMAELTMRQAYGPAKNGAVK